MAATTSHSSKAESVDGDTIEIKREPSRDDADEDDLRSTLASAIKDEPSGSAINSPALLPQKIKTSRSSSSSTVKSRATSASSIEKKEVVEALEQTSLKMEPSHPSKPSRSASQKAIPRAAPLFDYLEDATMEAKSTFAVLDVCTYANKFLGYTEHAMECDCSEEWGKSSTFHCRTNSLACEQD